MSSRVKLPQPENVSISARQTETRDFGAAIARVLPIGATVTLDYNRAGWSLDGRVVGVTAGTGVSSTVIMESI